MEKQHTDTRLSPSDWYFVNVQYDMAIYGGAGLYTRIKTLFVFMLIIGDRTGSTQWYAYIS